MGFSQGGCVAGALAALVSLAVRALFEAHGGFSARIQANILCGQQILLSQN